MHDKGAQVLQAKLNSAAGPAFTGGSLGFHGGGGCPQCGYCPHCGRSAGGYGFYPWWQPYEPRPFTISWQAHGNCN